MAEPPNEYSIARAMAHHWYSSDQTKSPGRFTPPRTMFAIRDLEKTKRVMEQIPPPDGKLLNHHRLRHPEIRL
jgi:hypothetical protein